MRKLRRYRRQRKSRSLSPLANNARGFGMTAFEGRRLLCRMAATGSAGGCVGIAPLGGILPLPRNCRRVRKLLKTKDGIFGFGAMDGGGRRFEGLD